MARYRYKGRHRISRRATFSIGGVALAVAVGAVVVTTTAGAPGTASADNPDRSQFVDITTVEPNVDLPRQRRGASTGTFTVDCGRNENGHFNPDNFIAQPGVRNGAQHLHDYVGNLSTDADSDDESLAAAGTTCRNGDQSTYFWPVVRIDTEDAGEEKEERERDNARESEAESKGKQGRQNRDGRQDSAGDLAGQDAEGELPGNEGEIQRPAEVDLTFRGSPVGDVEPMPRFLRVLYGDAKVSTNGPANARASWTCTGFEDEVLLETYVVCPEGSDVKRIHDFPSCWDGENTDSENHRDHIVYPNERGECEDGFTAVPQLRISLTYDIPREVQLAGQYKVDSFPEEDHNPLSDHDDFANVMSEEIMDRLVDCVNSNRTCKE
ncbi:DUF1996 domain-containing protein [Amycolatopsis suaedae]|uniref:DUF1996 domain-containing protein n=1 Tax=Amycolatopsis suaedae TaxID=2510978 RepID=A0A4Q7J877_9PSEU|nr:DUF1996 domain-containing protein [Amycolatopsis suaedae]RZQ62583.1 DUF1996 domain-containing protein [Amycolatopsis suaedae]